MGISDHLTCLLRSLYAGQEAAVRTGHGKTDWLQMEKWNEVKSFSHVWLLAIPCSLPGSSVHRIFQARVLEWVTISFSRGSSTSRDRAQVSRISGGRFTIWATREAQGVHQGHILSPWLFNLHTEYIMWNAGLHEAQTGIKIARRNINNLWYADDTTLMEERLPSWLRQ